MDSIHDRQIQNPVSSWTLVDPPAGMFAITPYISSHLTAASFANVDSVNPLSLF